MSNKDYWGARSVRWSRRSVLHGGLLAAAGIASGSVLTGCGGNPATPTVAATAVAAGVRTSAAPATPVAAQPKYGGVAKFALSGDAPTLDPHATINVILLGQGAGIAYSRLVKATAGPERKGDDILIAGDVAERWDQPDELTYVFKLRPGIRWHNLAPVNGRELAADDIVYSFNRQRDLKVTASFLPALEKIEAVDRQTLRITTPKPDADFLPALAAVQNVIVAREAVDLKGDLKEGPTIGTGAWIFEKWEPNSFARLRKNPDYFLRGVPYVDALELLRINDDATRLAAFRAQEVANTATGVTRADIEALKQQFPQLVTGASRTMGSGLEMGYDQTKLPFNDKRVRQAFQLAVDRQAIIDTVFAGDGWWSTLLVLPDFSYHLPEEELRTKWLKRDLAEAKRLLAEAGVAPGLEVELTHLQFNAAWTSAAELTVAQLKEAGINARLKLVDASTWNTIQTATTSYQAYHGAVLPATSTNGGLVQRYTSTGSRNPTRTRDPKLEEMIEKQAVMVRDPEGRKKALQEIQRYLLDQAYATPVWGSQSPYARWPWLKNYRNVQQPSGEHDPFVWCWLDR